jgi:hypothetical protein
VRFIALGFSDTSIFMASRPPVSSTLHRDFGIADERSEQAFMRGTMIFPVVEPHYATGRHPDDLG